MAEAVTMESACKAAAVRGKSCAALARRIPVRPTRPGAACSHARALFHQASTHLTCLHAQPPQSAMAPSADAERLGASAPRAPRGAALMPPPQRRPARPPARRHRSGLNSSACSVCRLRGSAAGRLDARVVPPCTPPRRREPRHGPAAPPVGQAALRAPGRARPRVRAARGARAARAWSALVHGRATAAAAAALAAAPLHVVVQQQRPGGRLVVVAAVRGHLRARPAARSKPRHRQGARQRLARLGLCAPRREADACAARAAVRVGACGRRQGQQARPRQASHYLSIAPLLKALG